MKSEDVFLSHLPKSKTDKAQNLAELLQYHDRQFIECAYLTLLGRHPDITGMKYYLGRLQSGVSKIQILDQILSSTEGKRSSANLPGLRTAIQRFKLSKIPLIKVFFKQFAVTLWWYRKNFERHLQRKYYWCIKTYGILQKSLKNGQRKEFGWSWNNYSACNFNATY